MSSSFTLKIDANEQAVIRAFFSNTTSSSTMWHMHFGVLSVQTFVRHFTDLENSCCKGKRHQLGEVFSRTSRPPRSPMLQRWRGTQGQILMFGVGQMRLVKVIISVRSWSRASLSSGLTYPCCLNWVSMIPKPCLMRGSNRWTAHS